MPKLIYAGDKLAAVILEDNEIELAIMAFDLLATEGEGIGVRLAAGDLHRDLSAPAPN